MNRNNANYRKHVYAKGLLPFIYCISLVPRLSKSLVKVATCMRVISWDSMGISRCPYYARRRVTSRTNPLTRVKEKPWVDVLLHIFVYARLKLYVWYGICYFCPLCGWPCCVEAKLCFLNSDEYVWTNLQYLRACALHVLLGVLSALWTRTCILTKA